MSRLPADNRLIPGADCKIPINSHPYAGGAHNFIQNTNQSLPYDFGSTPSLNAHMDAGAINNATMLAMQASDANMTNMNVSMGNMGSSIGGHIAVKNVSRHSSGISMVGSVPLGMHLNGGGNSETLQSVKSLNSYGSFGQQNEHNSQNKYFIGHTNGSNFMPSLERSHDMSLKQGFPQFGSSSDINRGSSHNGFKHDGSFDILNHKELPIKEEKGLGFGVPAVPRHMFIGGPTPRSMMMPEQFQEEQYDPLVSPVKENPGTSSTRNAVENNTAINLNRNNTTGTNNYDGYDPLVAPAPSGPEVDVDPLVAPEQIVGGLNMGLNNPQHLNTATPLQESVDFRGAVKRRKRSKASQNSGNSPLELKASQNTHSYKRSKKAKPGQPRPPGCKGKTSTSLKLFWFPPKDSGGHVVDSYQVQKREFDTEDQTKIPPWTDLFPQKGVTCQEFEVTGLAPGSLTQFRVKAHNSLGWGKFSRASDPFPTDNKFTGDDSSEIKGTVNPKAIDWDVPRIRLGKGAFGTVFRSAIGGYRGTTVAVKIEGVATRMSEQKEKMDDWVREVKILSSLRHPNLVLFMGACQSEGRLYILTEYMPGGSLENAIHRSQHPIRNRVVLQSILAQVACAVQYLHSNQPRVTHRDLKPANILLDRTWTLAKVCDFGLARVHEKEIMSTLTKYAGTAPYMAPEALGEEDIVTSKVDVYSFGVICAEILLLEKPFPSLTNAAMLKMVCVENKRPFELEGRVSDAEKKLIEDCWHIDPDVRPDFASIINSVRNLGWLSEL